MSNIKILQICTRSMYCVFEIMYVPTNSNNTLLFYLDLGTKRDMSCLCMGCFALTLSGIPCVRIHAARYGREVVLGLGHRDLQPNTSHPSHTVQPVVTF